MRIREILFRRDQRTGKTLIQAKGIDISVTALIVIACLLVIFEVVLKR